MLQCQWRRDPELEASLDGPGPGHCARPGTPRADSVPARETRRSPGLVAVLGALVDVDITVPSHANSSHGGAGGVR
jgi:hypothetical protein